MTPFIDEFGRVVRKLRVSLTDRCNFRCGYCMPADPKWADPCHNLNLDERLRLIRLLSEHAGLRAVRLTGGEPLLDPDLCSLIEQLRRDPHTASLRISLTTNAQLLVPRLPGLIDAGLDDINISLDSLNPDRFDRLTRTRNRLPAVLDAILQARATGLPVKINAVIIDQRNDQDIVPLIRWAADHDVTLRFIEFMPLDGGGWWRETVVFSEARILRRVADELGPVESLGADGPASYYRLASGQRFGVIPTVTRPFCNQCDRIRLTADGKLYTCLFSAMGFDLKPALRQNLDDTTLLDLIRSAVATKPAGYVSTGPVERPITMHSLGG